MAFTSAQNVEMNRMSEDRKTGGEMGDLVLSKLEKYSVAQLKARVNIISIGQTVEFADENNYTSQEQAYIRAANPHTNWMIAVPEILTRAATLQGEGLTPAAVVEILKTT